MGLAVLSHLWLSEVWRVIISWSIRHVIRGLVPMEWRLPECATASKEASRRLHKAQLRVMIELSLNVSSHARRSKQRTSTRTEQTKGEGR